MTTPLSTSARRDIGDRFAAGGLQVFERGWLSSNSVLFPSEEAGMSTLVDSGYWSHQDQSVGLVRQALGRDARLGRVVNTHLHSDHCGGNARLHEAFGCRIEVPSGEFDKVELWDEEQLTFRATGQHCPRFVADGRLVPGTQIELGRMVWDIVASPGHDPQSVMLHQPELAVLISADALWEDGFGVVFPELEGFSAFDDVRRTLDLVSHLNVEVVIPGHGRPFVDVGAALERARAKLDRFVADPRKHALHAAKVLIKFHLLEVQSQSITDLDAWLLDTAYFGGARAQYFADQSWAEWRSGLLDGLVRSQAIRFDGTRVFNL